MCPEGVLRENEVSINAVRYKLAGSVRRTLSSNYPPKLVTGDYTRDSSPILSTLALSDHRGGIGLDIMDGVDDADRSWYSTAMLRYKARLILPPLVTATSNLPAGATAFKALVEFKGALYAYINATNAGIYAYTDATTTWGSRLQTTAAVTDGVAGNIGGTYTIVFTDGTNLHYSTDGAAWSTVAVGATYLIIWDDKLFCVDSSGQLFYYTAMGGTAVNDAKIILGRIAELTGLIVGPNAAGEEIVYAVTSHGLYAHDFDNGKFILTAMRVANKTTATYTALTCACVWRNKIYYSSESTLFEYDVLGGIIRPIGPDKDGGLPAGGSLIVALQPSFNELIAVVAGNGTTLSSFLGGWDGQGWQVLAELGQIQGPFSILVSGAYGDYRLWFADDDTNTAKYIKRPVDLINPLRNTAFVYAASATHDWPWFTAGQSEVTKVAVRLKVETLNPTTSETVIISYASNWVEAVTPFATITAGGITTFSFPNSTTPTGTAFKSIRFRAALARGGTNTNTPQLISLTLEYYKKLDSKYQFAIDLDLSQVHSGNSPKAQRDAIRTAIESATLVEFTYRDPGSDSDATFYVQVRPQEAQEKTGYDQRSHVSLLLVEV